MPARKSKLTIAPAVKRSAARRNKATAAPAAEAPLGETVNVEAASGTKLDQVIALLSRQEGATIAQMVELTGWKARSVRGFMAGALKAKRGIEITSIKADGVRTYRIGAEAP